jgi:predicted ABC-type ATPase
VKDLIIVGGPNGAGKTSWSVQRLPSMFGVSEFVNADEIARGLSPLNPESSAIEAGRLMLERLDALAAAGASFAFETTCAGRGHARLIRRCRTMGYRIALIFLWLPSVDLALQRVARRVSEGGHKIADPVVARRYTLGLRNMRHLYPSLADIGLIYDNSDGAGTLIAERPENAQIIVHDEERWGQIEEATQ